MQNSNMLRYSVAAFVLIFCTTFLLIYNKRIQVWNLRYSSELKIILLWMPFFHRADYYFGLGQEPFFRHSCPVSNCEVTNNRSALNASHAVVFHHRDADIKDMPKFRKEWQRWVFFLMESPPNSYPDLKQFKGLYNWTMTYRMDSDIVASYGTVLPRQSPQLPGPDYTGIVAKKQKLAVWVVSHCKTPSKREDYVKKLAKHIPVDIYGDCGKMKCLNDICEEQIFARYKFFLSFENSLCVDYATEKLYKALMQNIVPVVFGGADYSALAPPTSYIDARKFKSPEDLAKYLSMLDQNNTLYAEYFQWKTMYMIEVAKTPFCDLCARLNEPNPTVKWYDDIYKWWMVGTCEN